MNKVSFVILGSLLGMSLVMIGLLANTSGFSLTNSQFTSQSADSLQTSLPPAVEQKRTNSTPVPKPEIPVSKIILGGHHVFQSFNNCGPASLGMTLSLLGEAASQQELGNSLRPYQNAQGNNDDKSVTLQELAAKAEEFGFLTYHRPAGTTEVLEQFVALDVPVITRTWLRAEEDIGHFRVVKGYDRSRDILVQDDSLQGANLEYQAATFDELWAPFNYEFLVVVPPDKQLAAEAILVDLLDEEQAWIAALSRADQRLANNPQDVLATFNRSVALYHLGKYDESVRTYERVAAELPARTLWYQLEPILAYYQTGQTEKLLSISQQILSNQNRAYSELYYLQALIHRQRGDQTAAAESLQMADRYNASAYWKRNLVGIQESI